MLAFLLGVGGWFVWFGMRPRWVATRPIDPRGWEARALGYHEDADQVDRKRYLKIANQKASLPQRCETCDNFRELVGNAQQGQCRIVQGQLVQRRGWCSAWVFP